MLNGDVGHPASSTVPGPAEKPQLRSIGALLRARAARSPEAEFLRYEGRSVSFGEAEAWSNKLANVLRSHGIGRRDRVAIMLPNCESWPLVWLGVTKLGAVAVPVNTQYRASDLQYVLRHSGASASIAARGFVPLIQSVREECPDLKDVLDLPLLEGEREGVLAAEMESATSGFDVEADATGLEDLCNLQYTSGTTGFPKACMLTHDYFLRLGRVAGEIAAIRGDDVALTAQPFYYLDPQWNTIMSLIAGIPLVVLPRFSASGFWEVVADSGATFVYLVGTMPILLAKQPASARERTHSLRVVLCSGIVPQLHKSFETRWGVPWREAYGMTESGVDLAVEIGDDDSVGTGTVGHPVPGKEVRIVDEDGRECPSGVVGELVTRGRPMMLGYWCDEEATAAAFRGGWLHSGDLARRDPEGRFFLVGRLKDMVRRGGENVSAAEVEAVLAEHDAVNAVAVVGVRDEIFGEEVKAFIRLQPGMGATLETARSIVDFAGNRLAPFKVPRFVEFVDEFPLTPSERVAKHELLSLRADQRGEAFDLRPEAGRRTHGGPERSSHGGSRHR